MQVQSIDNSNLNVKFKSRKSFEQASALVNMDDAQLMQYAYRDGHDKHKEKRHNRALVNSLYALPLIDTLASGATVIKSSYIDKDIASACRKAPLSVRTAVMARTAALWTAGIATVGLYGLAKKAITNNSEKAQNFERKNPVTSFMLDIGILSTGFILGQEAMRKVVVKHITKTYDKDPKAYMASVIATDEKIEKAFNKIDNTYINKKILPKFEKFMTNLAEKAPVLSKTARFAAVNSVWILLGLGIAKSMDHARKENNRVERNYIGLKNKQLEAAKYLNTELSVENDVLAQDNLQLASDLRTTINKKKPIDIEPERAHKHGHKHEEKADDKTKTKVIIIETEEPAKNKKKADKADSKKTKSEE